MKSLRLAVGGFSVFVVLAMVNSAFAANIVETAASAGQFKTLVKAVQAAGLADDLASSPGITVFAPTDAAFEKLPKGTLSSLLLPENKEKLRAILTYHVLSKEVAAKDVPHHPASVETLNGASVRVVRRSGAVRVNRAHVVKADIKADNGVIHVINQVLIPGHH